MPPPQDSSKQHNGQKDGVKTSDPLQNFYCKGEFQLLHASAVV